MTGISIIGIKWNRQPWKLLLSLKPWKSPFFSFAQGSAVLGILHHDGTAKQLHDFRCGIFFSSWPLVRFNCAPIRRVEHLSRLRVELNLGHWAWRREFAFECGCILWFELLTSFLNLTPRAQPCFHFLGDLDPGWVHLPLTLTLWCNQCGHQRQVLFFQLMA